MIELPFIKMHGCGNDFVIVDNRVFKHRFTQNQLQHISHRKNGIGCDQVIILEESNNADCFMRIFNPDGSEAEACGNGTRCVAFLLFEECKNPQISIETIAGTLDACCKSQNEITVNMGYPKTKWHEIPLVTEMDTQAINLVIDDLKQPSAINIGNPHLVFFVDYRLDIKEIEEIGISLGKHYYFPEGININFVEIINQNEIYLRTYERGTGLTLACGTGACASVAVAFNKKLTGNNVLVKQNGGNLKITIKDDGSIMMCGEIKKSFVGVIEI